MLKNRLKKEGSETVTKCNRLKMEAEGGTDFYRAGGIITRQVAETEQTRGLEENKTTAYKGGRIAKNARLELEQKTGKRVISKESFKFPDSRKPKRLA